MGEESRRMGHGSVRAIEDLRGLRLSLVPGPEPRQRVLPRMRNKTEGISIAGEQKAARASRPQAALESLGGG